MALRRLPTTHPYLTYNALILPISYVALSSTPSLPSISLLLSILILQSTTILNRSPRQLIPTILSLSLGSTLSNLSASTTALSSPASSLILSFLRSAFTSSIALILLSLRWTITRRAHTTTTLSKPIVQLTAFPALWALGWALVSAELPSGRVGLWTPLTGDDAYRWTRPYFGLSGEDFVVAAWAEVGAAFAGMWIQGSNETEDEDEIHEGRPLIGSNAQQHQVYGSTAARSPKSPSRNKSPLILTALLFLLTLPSYTHSPLPLPLYSPNTTPLSVACVLPPTHNPNSPKTPLDEYIKETRSVAPRAKIVLWPEGAVAFRTAAEKAHAIELVRNTTRGNGVWVGMAFEEPADFDAGTGRGRMVRNGMAFIGPDPKHPVIFEYYKRNLVPIAESHSQVPGTKPPPITTISLPFPSKDLPSSEKSTWPRDITLSTSICLDFSRPLPLSARPHLILAPARTWHPQIGEAMSRLAGARAEEVGGAVLWCDGGDGAVGGVYGFGRGMGGVEEVGNKGRSWVVRFGVPFDGEEGRERTVYARFGAWAAVGGVFAFVAVAVGVERVVGGGEEEDEGWFGGVMEWFRGVKARREAVESGRSVTTGNLLGDA